MRASGSGRPINGSDRFGSATAFRASVEQRLKLAARQRKKPLNELRREFVVQRFLSLVFADPTNRWVLKGGSSLVLRLEAARYSRDVDLLRLDDLDADQAVEELSQLIQPAVDDHLRFVIGPKRSNSLANPVTTISVDGYVGAAVFDSFPIDIARQPHMTGTLERIAPQPVVDVPGLSHPPEIVVYPLADQIADKTCAMFEDHDGYGSTRYRDLVDLALIVTSCSLDADKIIRAFDAESRRRHLDLPITLTSPNRGWSTGYPATARKSPLSSHLHSLEQALQVVGHCLNPILAGTVKQATWVPGHGWVASPAGPTVVG